MHQTLTRTPPHPLAPFIRQIVQVQENLPHSQAFHKGWTPRVDILEEENRFVIFADIPGIDPKDIEIEIDKNTLVIRGERPEQTKTDTLRVSRTERSTGRFTRQFELPETVEQDSISAQGSHGVLEISLPKRPEVSPRRISVA